MEKLEKRAPKVKFICLYVLHVYSIMGYGGGELMESLKERASEVSFYLQHLTEPTIFSEVQNTIMRKDKDTFMEACKKVKIPEKYIAILMTVLFTVGPTQIRWP